MFKQKTKQNGRELIENEFKQVLCRSNRRFGRSTTTCTNTGCLVGIAHPHIHEQNSTNKHK